MDIKNDKMDKLKMKCIGLKMPRVLMFFLIVLFVGNGTLHAQKNETNSVEKIGKHLSELLISRGDIEKSPFAINIERLFPDENFSEFEDSPAGLIVAMLYGAQLTLPETWAELLLQADSLGVNKNAKYLKTYYEQRNKDNFVLTCVLKQSSKYYAFSSVVLGWEDDKYVMRLYKKMKEYNNKKELEENLFSIVIEEHLEELKQMEMEDDIENPDIKSFKQGFKYGLEQRLNNDTSLKICEIV